MWTTKDAFNNVGYITACRNDENASLYRCIRSKPMHIKFERKKGIITQSLEGMLDYKVLKWNCCIKERLPRRNILLKRPNNNYLDTMNIQEEAEWTLLYIYSADVRILYHFMTPSHR